MSMTKIKKTPLKNFYFILFFFLINLVNINSNTFALDNSIEMQKSFETQRDFSDKRITFQEPASTSMIEIIKLHKIMFSVMLGVFLFVCLILIFVIFKFHESKIEKPSKFSHNTKLEIIWTSIPLLIVLFLAITSLRSLNKIEKLDYSEKSDVTLKIVGHQWYWTYEYPEHGIQFDSYMKQDKDLIPGDKRLLSTDNAVYLPENKNIKIIVTADDVIHSWAIPAFGIKKDCVPGRLNETWFKTIRKGTFFGQCSEFCGILHGFMPIEVKIVNEEDFNNWKTKMKEKFPLNN